MDPKNAQLEKEECRELVLGYLALRQELRFRVEAIERGLRREKAAEYSGAEIGAALAFLEGERFVEQEPHGLGATVSWKATSAGVKAHERSGR